MKEEFGIKPNTEHYGCVVDLLGRAGLVRDAYKYIQDMPIPPNAMHKNKIKTFSFGEIARAHLQILEPGHSGDYVLISNLYASERRWSDVHKVRRKMVRDKSQKSSWSQLRRVKEIAYMSLSWEINLMCGLMKYTKCSKRS
ncbi:hypothetical protein QQ045_032336 [Rhodiola kirilowii]